MLHKNKILALIALIITPSEAAIASEEIFDSLRSGVIKSEIIGDKPKYESYSYHFILDITNMAYCYTELGKICGNIKPILNVTEHNITLKIVDNIGGNEIIKNVEFFNRSTGAHYAHYISKYTDRTARMLAIIWEGNCERMPFSGLPRFQQKF